MLVLVFLGIEQHRPCVKTETLLESSSLYRHSCPPTFHFSAFEENKKCESMPRFDKDNADSVDRILKRLPDDILSMGREAETSNMHIRWEIFVFECEGAFYFVSNAMVLPWHLHPFWYSAMRLALMRWFLVFLGVQCDSFYVDGVLFVWG